MSKYKPVWRDVIRPIVLARDEFTCVLCQCCSLANHVHHLDKNKSNFASGNLITVCAHCHPQIEKMKISGCQLFRRNSDEAQKHFNQRIDLAYSLSMAI